MKKKISQIILLPVLALGLFLAGCGANPDLATPLTDTYEMDFEFDGLNFFEDGIGEVKLASATDGDTANFNPISDSSPNARQSVRFLGIDTPESTARVQPWGKPASVWVKSKLENAERIVLINDFAAFGQTENNGRYLGFVWYTNKGSDRFRLLNLEVIEQAYSSNKLWVASVICPYAEIFAKAEADARLTKRRIWGEKDPGFDYSTAVVEPNIRSIRENFDSLGISESGSSGKALRVTAIILGLSKDSLYVRDLYNPDPITGEFSSIYVYAGFGNPLFSMYHPGDIIQFSCRAGMHNNAMQLTDYAKDGEKTERLLAYNGGGTISNAPIKTMDEATLKGHLKTIQTKIKAGEELVYSYEAYDRMNKYGTVTTPNNFGGDNGLFIETAVVIRQYKDFEDTEKGQLSENKNYKLDAESKIYNVYANPATLDTTTGEYVMNDKVSLNLWFDSSYEPYFMSDFALGNVLRVRGYMTNAHAQYRIQLFNNTPTGPCYPYVSVI